MLFHSALRKELSRSFGATLIVLVTVVMTMTLIRTLGQASRGSFNPSDVTLVMGYTVLAYMPTLLAMSLYIAIIGTLSRMYSDSEMVIWFCSGRGLAATLRPLFRFAWPVFAMIAALALLLLPWTNQRIEDLKNQYEQRSDIERIEPGQFQESADGSRVFFVEKSTNAQGKGSNVFIATQERGRETVTSARSGRLESVDQRRFLMLKNGQRLERNASTGEVKVSEFEEYGTEVSPSVLSAVSVVPVNTLTTATLLDHPDATQLGELSWRLGLILAAINFVIIGAALSGVNPRVGRSANLMLAMFSFVVYFNLLNLGQNWIATGKLSFATFMLTLHGGVLLAALTWLARCHNNWHWRQWLRRSPTVQVRT